MQEITLEQKAQAIKDYCKWVNSTVPADIFLTSLRLLHPVAMQVKAEILSFNHNLADWPEFYAIINSCSVSPRDGMYIDLFNAVYDGIVAINEYTKEL